MSLTAAERTEGMGTIVTEKPDLAILYVMISTCSDGFEMPRELESDPNYKNMPVLIHTGVAERTGVSFKSSAGDPEWSPVYGFLDKPVEPQFLLAGVKKLKSKKA